MINTGSDPNQFLIANPQVSSRKNITQIHKITEKPGVMTGEALNKNLKAVTDFYRETGEFTPVDEGKEAAKKSGENLSQTMTSSVRQEKEAKIEDKKKEEAAGIKKEEKAEKEREVEKKEKTEEPEGKENIEQGEPEENIEKSEVKEHIETPEPKANIEQAEVKEHKETEEKHDGHEESHEKGHKHHEPLWVEGSDVSHLGAVALNNIAKTAGHGAEALSHGGEATSHAVESATHGAEVLHGASQSTSALYGVTAAAAGIGAVGLIANSVREFKEGNNVAGTSSLVGGLGSAGEAVAGTLHATHAFGATGAAIAGVASTAAGVLGGVHGAIEIGRGAKEIYDGIKEHDKDKIVSGALQVGVGGALIGAVVTGGVLPAVAAVVLVGAKIAYNNKEKIAELGHKAKETVVKVGNKIGETAGNVGDTIKETWNNTFHRKKEQIKEDNTDNSV